MNAARRGGVLIRLLMIVTVVGLAGMLAWTTLANHRATGAWSFHPLDTAWWSPKAATPNGADPFVEVTQDAKRWAGQAGEAMWGSGGLVERCEAWWHTTQGERQSGSVTPAPVAPSPATPPAATPSGTGVPPVTPVIPTAPTSVRGLLEQRLTASEKRFAEGIELAKRARPSLSDDAATLASRMGTLRQARACFAEVERDLTEAIPAYQAIPGHDVSKLASARQLQGFARQMQELTRLTP